MNLAADMGRHSGRATPSLHDRPYRQIEETTGRRSTYPSPIPVQTNPATSEQGQRNPTIVTLFEIASALGVSHVDLVAPDHDND